MNTTRCEGCGGKFDALSRQATQNAMGPWWIRDAERPFRPGCAYETIRAMVGKGLITGQTVLRGPTTRQFWRHARRVPGVAHLLGVCHACQREVSPEAFMCPACGASFAAETDRQHLGLSTVSLLPGQASAEKIAAVSVPTGPVGSGVPHAASGGAAAGSLAGMLGSVLDEGAVVVAPGGRGVKSGDAMHEALASVRAIEHGAEPRAEHEHHHHRRRHGPSPVAMVAFFVLGIVVTVCAVGVPLITAQGGFEQALAALGLGEIPARLADAEPVGPGGAEERRDEREGTAVALGGEAAAPGGPAVPESSVAPVQGAPVQGAPVEAAPPVDVLRDVRELVAGGGRDDLRDALRVLERLARDGAVEDGEAAAWRRAIESRLSREAMAGLP